MTASMVTIRDVASEAGVAVSTVSRVLNDSGYASAAARERVLGAAERLGFRPNVTARGLRRARTMTIGMLVSDLANPVFIEHLRGAEHVAQRHGYALLIGDGQASAAVQAAQLERLYRHRVDGVILSGPVLAPQALAPFLDAGIPVEPRVVRRGRQITTGYLRSESSGSLDAFRSLIALGHRHFATCQRAGDGQHPAEPAGARLDALRTALAECDAALVPERVLRAETVEDCRAAVAMLMARPQPPTVFVAINHLVAPALLIALNDAGLRIPDDVSFLAYGDSPWAQAFRPPISVIRSDYYAEASMSAESLIAQIEQWPERPVPAPLRLVFLPRGSTGPPPARPPDAPVDD